MMRAVRRADLVKALEAEAAKEMGNYRHSQYMRWLEDQVLKSRGLAGAVEECDR